MEANEVLIRDFYEAFQRKDFRSMQAAYHADAVFSDPVFPHLTALQTRAMWAMLLSGAADLVISFGNVRTVGDKVRCRWEARYTFSGTGRKVHNVIDTEMEVKEGKIFRHRDRFDFWRWSRMALGVSGLLLGWTPYLLGAVREKARARLGRYMNSPG